MEVQDAECDVTAPAVTASAARASESVSALPLDPSTARLARYGRLALLAALGWHSRAWMADPTLGPQDATALLHGVSLAMHETGHLVFAPFGETLMVLGGTLLQLLLPAAFAAHFAWRRAGYAAAVCLWWVAQNGWDVAVYVADARAEALPLVGGGEHDWALLLMRWELLDADVRLARAISGVAAVLAIVALVGGAVAALGRGAAAGEERA